MFVLRDGPAGGKKSRTGCADEGLADLAAASGEGHRERLPGWGSGQTALGITRQSASRELGRYGITVNAISPAAITPMTETIRTDERFQAKYLERIPLGRWGTAEEMTGGFVFLASDEASYVTGIVLRIDGGMST